MRWWRQLVIAAAVAITYANSLHGPFILDDQATIVQNDQIRDLSDLSAVLMPRPGSPVAGRPLASLSFALNYAAHGLSVRGYHLVNIGLHIGAALLLFAVARLTLGFNLALAATLLWALHPLNSEAVNYISQRTELLAAVFLLLTVYSAVRAAPLKNVRVRRRWELLAIGASIAGALSKETAAVIPLVVALYDRTFLFESWREAFARRTTLYAGLALTWVAMAAMIATGARSAVAGLSSGISPWTYLLNQAEMIATYLRLAVWPDALVAFYGWPRAIAFADVAPQFLFIAALVALTTLALVRWPRLGFLGAFFFLTLAPASSIIPVATEVGAERRMYLPLIALTILAVVLVDRLAQRTRRVPMTRVAAIAGVLACVVLARTTWLRNSEYESAVRLAQTIVERRPTPIAHHIYGAELLLEGRAPDAESHLRAAIAGGDSRARYNLGHLLFEQGDYPQAIAELQAYVKTSELPYRLVPRWLEPPLLELIPARFTLARALALQGRWDEAVTQANLILAQVPGHVGVRGLLGDAAFARRDWRRAAAEYRAYLERKPDDVNASVNCGIAQVALGDLDEAIRLFSRAATIDPANARARQLLALAQEDRAARR